MSKKTKIVCTLGPSSDSVTILAQMIDAGMNVARLNFSHGSYDHMKHIIGNVRKASQKTSKPVALLQDLQGPKIRLGTLPETGIPVKKGETILLSTDPELKTHSQYNVIPVQYAQLHEDVKVGDALLIDDGYLEVKIIKKEGKNLFCSAKTSWILKSHKGINCPTASIRAKTITAKDWADLDFGLKQGIDYVALSFVKSAQDIEELRGKLHKKGHPEVKIIAKIERHEAVKNLEAIAKASDGLMVARGDLGIEIPAEQVPIVQKEMVHLGLKYGKPVIIATQILESMIQNPRATRAEISDAATAIFDHADAFMLSGETSTGKYPLRAVQTLAKVAHAVEKELEKKSYLLSQPRSLNQKPLTDATCTNAALLAEEIGAEALVVFTQSGYTAEQIMKHRPRTPVVAVTPNPTTFRQLQLVWGIHEIIFSKTTPTNETAFLKTLVPILKEKWGLKSGNEIVWVNAQKGQSFIRTIVL
ncbi:MAG: hypothetical protein ACD_28C00048G0005 [uncultured bacterium]|nr:MAG: hypothetical protein ACD_28C00048G0005 [uncultured bacterium]KKT76925.1 MAG: Pyruvate kinase [Candidatus Peregrinibacteria bacterium GW2011_GWA2_44_7]